MKKIITLLMSVVLAFGMVGLVGCDSTFNGNYKEVSADSAEVRQFAEETENADGRENFSIINGAEIEFRMKGGAQNTNVDLTAKTKIASVGEDARLVLQAEGSVKGKVEKSAGDDSGNVDLDVKFYYTEGYGYLNGKVKVAVGGVNNETELKNKIPFELEKGLGAVAGAASLSASVSGIRDVISVAEGNIFAEIVAMAEGQNGVRIYLDADAKKVKVEFSNADTEGFKTSGTLYLVYDGQYNLIAVKADAEFTFAEGEKVSLYFLFKGYKGKVKVPSEKEREEYKITAGLNLGF